MQTADKHEVHKLAITSKYDGKCKDCRTEHKVGDSIDQNRNGNWCKMGDSCPGVKNANQTTIQSTAEKLDDRIERAKKITEQFIILCKEHGAEAAIAQAASVWNTEAMRK